MSPTAAAAVSDLLGDGVERLVDIATWADEYIEEDPATYPWHSVEIPYEASAYDRGRDCPDGDCIVAKIETFARTLADHDASETDRAIALRFLVHLIADIHTPLHAVRPRYRPVGMWVYIGDELDTLHLWWDNQLVDAIAETEIALADSLEQNYPPNSRNDWRQGTPEEWANESFVLARDFSRKFGIVAAMRENKGTPEAPLVLPSSVFEDVKPIIERRLYEAGLRLAGMLNDLLR